MNHQYINRVVDLTDPSGNLIYNMTVDQARELVRTGDPAEVRKIDGPFALVSVEGKTVRMARSISMPMRYFIAKLIDGPCLVISDRIDRILDWLRNENLQDQFHPSYTRMVPAHYITRIDLLGCPDPNPVYDRFFRPQRNKLPNTDLGKIGEAYMGMLYNEIKKWLHIKANKGPVGVSFSAGIDSGSVFLLTYKALRDLGESPSRLKAFTLSVDGDSDDLKQAWEFLDAVGLTMFLEPVEIKGDELDWKEAIRITEDYKPLDIQSATMNVALLKEIRKKYPDWKYMIDGDGGDENLKDYPIEENPELTIRSVLNNLMLYQEGWGVESIKHSLTYTGGLSRAYTRSYAPARHFGFESFSPYTLPDVIEIAEGIPFIDLTGWDHKKLYGLKGEIVSRGIKSVTGIEMPVFPKRRFQHGALAGKDFQSHFPEKENEYRRNFESIYE